MLQRIEESARCLRRRIRGIPFAGMITGTGLEAVLGAMQVEERIPYAEIPHFPVSTAEGHRGTLAFGTMGGRPLLAMEGRFHLFEGYGPREITFPVRVMRHLGVRHLFISSAVGGLNPFFAPGDLMLVRDHLNLTGSNPLVGPNLEAFGPRFPDMTRAYDPALGALARQRALELGIHLREGIYAGLLGPSIETPAETRYLRGIGADAVGFSTVHEVIVGVHCGMKVLAVVAVTNVNRPDCMAPVAIEEVLDASRRAAHSLGPLWEGILVALGAEGD